MSMPKIPDIQPKINISRQEVVDLILASIGLEELSLAHILNAEAEKLQQIIKSNPTFEELIKANRTVERILRGSIKKEMLLQFKLEDVIDSLLEKTPHHHKPHDPHGPHDSHPHPKY